MPGFSHRLYCCGLSLAAALTAGVQPAAANIKRQSSMITTIDLKQCRQVAHHRDGGAWMCSGIKGYPIYVAEGDLRMYVSFGIRPNKRIAASQTLGPFNTIFTGRGVRAVVEWRRNKPPAAPHAAILRYFTTNDGVRGETLVVFKVSAGETCQMAHIDALAVRDAVEVARRMADEKTDAFDCKSSPTAIAQ